MTLIQFLGFLGAISIVGVLLLAMTIGTHGMDDR